MNTTALLTKEGLDGQELFFVGQSALMGSSASCEVAVKNAAPQHCRVFRSKEGYEARDLTGQSLIKINGKPTSGALLQEGDLLQIGPDTFRFSEVLEPEGEAGVAQTARPSKESTRRIPRPASRLGKTTRSIPVVSLNPSSTPAMSRRPAPLVALAIAGIVLVAVLAVFLCVPRSSPKAAPSPNLVSKPAPGSGTTGVRRPKEVEVPERAGSRRTGAPAEPVALPAVDPAPEPAASSRPPASEAPKSETSTFIVPAFTPPVVPAGSVSRAGLDDFLKDPSRRSPGGERLPIHPALRFPSPNSEVLRAAAIALCWTPNAWDLNASQALVWSTYAKGTSFEALELLSTADHVARAQMLLEGGRAPVLRLFALAHLVEALPGDPSIRSLLNSAGFRPTDDEKRWGEAHALLQEKVAHYYRGNARDDSALEARALASSDFGTHYLGLLIEIDQSLRRGTAYQATWGDLVGSVAPEAYGRGSAHLRALAESYRKAVYCKECKNGRVPCPQCQGKGRIDLPCPACRGEGRIMAPGAANGALVSQRCPTCEGKKVFKQVGCATCSRSGTIGCSSCGANPWRENSCTNPNCRGGWVRCQTCRGGGRVDAPCPDCNGTGRVMASGAANGAIVTQKCRSCQEDHGVFKRVAKCPSCAGLGLVKCGTCQGKTGEQKTAVAALSDIFTTEACTECGGSGWPSPRMAVPCPRCLGLGIRVKPVIDPSKTLD